MAYAIMRCKKLSSMGSVASALQHCYRERETANADPSRTPDNEHMAARSTDEAMGRLRGLLPEKRRRDAVLAVEYLMTASPEWWRQATPEQQQDFFVRSRQWLADKYGEQNIIAATVHRDETSPHLSAFVVPLTKDGRLSAKEFVGNRAQMTRDQTTFAAAVADLGLVRGIEGSKARHARVRALYAALEAPPAAPRVITPASVTPRALPPRTLTERLGLSAHVESADSVADRLSAAVQRAYEPVVVAATVAHEMRARARQAQATAESLRNELQPVMRAISGLSGRERQDAIRAAAEAAAAAAARYRQAELDAALNRLRQQIAWTDELRWVEWVEWVAAQDQAQALAAIEAMLRLDQALQHVRGQREVDAAAALLARVPHSTPLPYPALCGSGDNGGRMAPGLLVSGGVLAYGGDGGGAVVRRGDRVYVPTPTALDLGDHVASALWTRVTADTVLAQTQAWRMLVDEDEDRPRHRPRGGMGM